MNKKYIELKKGETIVIYSNYKAIEIKRFNNSFSVSATKNLDKGNISIKSLTLNELNGFVLTKLIENSCIPHIKNNQIIINQLLDNYYNFICEKNYASDEISNIEFQAITYYEKE